MGWASGRAARTDEKRSDGRPRQTSAAPGDLVFFEVEDDPNELDHTGIYLGIDSDGHHRFMSSRERANGPTFGDLGGTSLLDDNGMYSKAWRAARRI